MPLIVHLSELENYQGQVLPPTEWLSVQQSRIDQFAEATDDHQWIHVDGVRAKDGPFGRTIAHGYLTLALVNKFMPQLIEVRGASMGVNYGCEKVRFPVAVLEGARIRGVGEIVDVAQVQGGKQMILRVIVEIEGSDRPGCVVDTISRFYGESS